MKKRKVPLIACLMTGTAVAGIIVACTQEREEPLTASGIRYAADTEAYDLPRIQEAGELIAVTLSGPDTYYEYRGQAFGTQFVLAEAFARSVGARLRMETARDTAELLQRLERNDADLIALELPVERFRRKAYTFCGPFSDSTANGHPAPHSQWLVRSNAPLLSQALNEWFTPSLKARLTADTRRPTAESHGVRRQMRAPLQSQRQGIISPYDAHFIRHAASLGWDWRLMAAQCYQESGFDPQAVSWAGARGLMQIMPATAAHLGLAPTKINDPAQNIQAATRYLRELNRTFADIPRNDERISFVLAAYNGGAGHVRDAMMLARKAGKDETQWNEVAPFVRLLSQPKYYNDPVVKYGFLRGEETYTYVKSIRERWHYYRSRIRNTPAGSVPSPSKKSLRNGAYRSKVVRPGQRDTIGNSGQH